MSIVKIERAVITKAEFDKQLDLLAKFKLPQTAIERHYVRVDVAEDGREQYVLCKRENPIKVFDISDGEAIVATVARTYADRVGINKMKGKYNDENRLVTQNDDGLKVGEVEAWASM